MPPPRNTIRSSYDKEGDRKAAYYMRTLDSILLGAPFSREAAPWYGENNDLSLAFKLSAPGETRQTKPLQCREESVTMVYTTLEQLGPSLKSNKEDLEELRRFWESSGKTLSTSPEAARIADLLTRAKRSFETRNTLLESLEGARQKLGKLDTTPLTVQQAQTALDVIERASMREMTQLGLVMDGYSNPRWEPPDHAKVGQSIDNTRESITALQENISSLRGREDTIKTASDVCTALTGHFAKLLEEQRASDK